MFCMMQPFWCGLKNKKPIQLFGVCVCNYEAVSRAGSHRGCQKCRSTLLVIMMLCVIQPYRTSRNCWNAFVQLFLCTLHKEVLILNLDRQSLKIISISSSLVTAWPQFWGFPLSKYFPELFCLSGIEGRQSN